MFTEYLHFSQTLIAVCISAGNSKVKNLNSIYAIDFAELKTIVSFGNLV